MLYHAREHMLNISGGRMRYIAFGNGLKPLIMIQGLNTRSIEGAAVPLAHMYRIFSKGDRVYLFDRRTNVREGVTVKELAEEILAGMGALGISNAGILGGYQWGRMGT